MTSSERLSKSDTILKDQFKGVTDQKFKTFMQNANDNFVSVGDGLFDVSKSLEHMVKEAYPEVSEFSTGRMATRLIQRLTNLKKAEILKVVSVKPGKTGPVVDAADRENLLFAVAYLYAQKELENGSSKKGTNSTMIAGLRKMEELWGKNARAQMACDAITHINQKALEKMGQKDTSDTYPETRTSLKVPEWVPQLTELTVQVIYEKMEDLKKRFEKWNVSGSEIYVTAEDVGLLWQSLKAFGFVYHFDRKEMAYYSSEGNQFLLTELLRQMKYCTSVMTDLEARARKRYGPGRIREANLNDLYNVRSARLNEEEMIGY